jgi:hypothetical protein
MDRLFLRMDSQTRQVRSKGIPAFGLNYWSTELGGIERVDRTGRAIQYNFRYDPVDISRISVFRNGEWIGDGYARELQQADGRYLLLSLAEWKAAKRLVALQNDEHKGNTPEEKKAAQGSKPKLLPVIEEKRQNEDGPFPPGAEDEETQRVLRFLHQ